MTGASPSLANGSFHGRPKTEAADTSSGVARIRAKGVAYSYAATPDESLVIGDVSFDLGPSEPLAIMGASGIGKTTLCRVLAGLVSPTRGEVLIDGNRLQGPTSQVALVFQHYPSFPWLTVEQNVFFGLRCINRHRSTDETQHARWLLQEVGLSAAAALYPRQLSGGMLQRLALARSLAVRPSVVILDEPFSSVDALVRKQLRELIVHLQHSEGFALILVTHDLDDAFALAKRVLVLAGRPARPVADTDVGPNYEAFADRVLQAMAEDNKSQVSG